jgi:hypothetical protein
MALLYGACAHLCTRAGGPVHEAMALPREHLRASLTQEGAALTKQGESERGPVSVPRVVACARVDVWVVRGTVVE